MENCLHLCFRLFERKYILSDIVCNCGKYDATIRRKESLLFLWYKRKFNHFKLVYKHAKFI